MGQSYTCLHYHLVFSTEQRRALIAGEIRPRLHDYMAGIIKELDGQAIAINGMPDHVHILARLHPTRAVADVLRVVKANSSKWVRQTFSVGREFAWQKGYSAFAVSRSNVERVRRYVEGQEAHHKTRTFQDELIALLERHGVEYDTRYIWS